MLGRPIVGTIVASLLLVSCTTAPHDEVTPEVTPEDSTTGTDVAGEVEVIPAFIPGGSAQDNLPYISYVLQEAGAGTGIFGSLDAVEVLEEAGFSRSDMEVTSDRTKLELAAESVTIAVIIDGECALGQWGASWFSSSVTPLLGSGTCLLGDTLSLD